MSVSKKWVVALSGGLLSAAMIAVPAYALGKCGMCASEGVAMAAKIKSGGVTLMKAIEEAEKRTRATALTAFTEKADDKLVFVVYLASDKKIMMIEVDEQGKTGGIQDAEELPGVHDPEAHKPKLKPGA